MRKVTDFKNYLLDRCIPEPNTGCWLWTRATMGKNGNEYGTCFLNYKAIVAHRLSYKTFKGDFDHKLDVCHKCDTPLCINPDHLFLGTHADNMRDCVFKGRNPKMLKQSHCKNGHELYEKNILWKNNRKGKHRICKICYNDKRRQRRGALCQITRPLEKRSN